MQLASAGLRRFHQPVFRGAALGGAGSSGVPWIAWRRTSSAAAAEAADSGWCFSPRRFRGGCGYFVVSRRSAFTGSAPSQVQPSQASGRLRRGLGLATGSAQVRGPFRFAFRGSGKHRGRLDRRQLPAAPARWRVRVPARRQRPGTGPRRWQSSISPPSAAISGIRLRSGRSLRSRPPRRRRRPPRPRPSSRSLSSRAATGCASSDASPASASAVSRPPRSRPPRAPAASATASATATLAAIIVVFAALFLGVGAGLLFAVFVLVVTFGIVLVVVIAVVDDLFVLFLDLVIRLAGAAASACAGRSAASGAAARHCRRRGLRC